MRSNNNTSGGHRASSFFCLGQVDVLQESVFLMLCKYLLFMLLSACMPLAGTTEQVNHNQHATDNLESRQARV